MSESTTVWVIIVAMGLGSFGLRFLFLGVIGDRELPEWVLRHLRYTAVAVLPGLVAPLVLWPTATEGQPDPARLAAAAVTLGVGYITKNVLAAIFGGAATLFLGLYFL
ncbi:MAG: AzlD domain-containing protein [Shimia sp.]|uniref:AzlD domain-containing protein n=1 Tax=Shimia sp. TaxID=1954381 RepID=UPI001B1DA728|nr:AzlD domain-containing protein [Shimia sp.]MBO6896187.1 AzlD domain-containing protein [Shimia sp.]